MMTVKRYLSAALPILTAMVFAAGCASTKLESITKDPAFEANRMKRVLVLAVVNKPSIRRMLEDECVRVLSKHETSALAAYTLAAEGVKLDETAWQRLMADLHVDYVLITRLTDFTLEKTEVPPQYIESPRAIGSPGSYGYYNRSYGYVYQPGYTIHKQTAAMETKLFRAADDQNVWSATSKTTIEEDREPEKHVREFVGRLMSQLYR